MRINYITNALGLILFYFGLVILTPIIVAFIYKDYDSVLPFVSASAVSLIISFILRSYWKSPENYNDMKRKEGLFLVALSWTLAALITSIPFLFYGLSPINAFFEATSGITATGSTILADFTLYPEAFFFWRSMSQWLGGMGIIVLFIAILPQLAVAGRQLFFTELPGPVEERITPRIKHTATTLWGLYIILTIIEITLLIWAGMHPFDAVCNSFSTISAGGFSPNPESIMGYGSDIFEIIVIVFMFIAGANFALQYRVISTGKFNLLFKNSEFKTYFTIVIVSALLLAYMVNQINGYSITDSLRHGFFKVLSILTTTGFASQDFATWELRALVILFAMMLIGACAGSTGGGVKIVRLLVGFKYMLREIPQALHPKAVIPVKLNKTSIAPEVLRQILAFIFLYFSIFIISGILITIIENDVIEGFTGTIATLGNIGPAFSPIGPMESFNDLSILTKFIFSINMLAGRLELIPFLVMFNPDFWRFQKAK